MGRWIDPFGAPEFLVTEVAYREIVGGDWVREAWMAPEHGEGIIRFKAVIPIASLLLEHHRTRTFCAARPQLLLRQ